MSNTHYGNKHKFTSYQDNPNVFLEPGAEEVLNISGVLNIVDNNFTSANVLINGVPLSATTLFQYNLHDLQDVGETTIEPSVDQVLTFSTSGKWEAINVNTNYYTYNLLDVAQDIEPVDNNVLMWVSGRYTPTTPQYLTIDLIDVSTQRPLNNQYLQFSSDTNKYEPIYPITYSNVYKTIDLLDVSTQIPENGQYLRWTTNNKYEPTSNITVNTNYFTYNLLDVSTKLPSDNQILSFSTITNKYEPINPATYAYKTTDLIDVSTKVATNNQILSWTSNNRFEPISPTTYYNVKKTTELIDVSTVIPSNNQILVYDNTSSKYVPTNQISVNTVYHTYDLADVSPTTLILPNSVLQYDLFSGKYEPNVLDIPVNLNDLDNVNANPLGFGYVLEYNPITFNWQASKLDDIFDGGEGKPGSLVINVPLILVGGFAAISAGDLSNTIKPLTNVNISATSLSHNQTIQYSTVDNLWHNITLPNYITQAGPTALSGLTDVSFTTLKNNQILRWTSTNEWRNHTFNMGDIANTNLTGIQDYDIMYYTNNLFGKTNVLKNAWNLLQMTNNYDYGATEYLYVNTDDTLISKSLSYLDMSDFDQGVHDNTSINYMTAFSIKPVIEPNDILIANLSERFTNIPFSTMMIDIEQLRDFNGVSPNDGQILVASSSVWTAANPTTYSSVYNTYQLQDFSPITNISNGMIPRYDSPTSKYIATTLNYLTSVSLNTKNLTDWVTTTFSNLQIPQYISSTSKFTAFTMPNFLTAVPNNSISLDNLSDVTLTSLVSSDILCYSGAQFRNIPFYDLFIENVEHNMKFEDLADINVSSDPTGRVLFCDGTFENYKWFDYDPLFLSVGTSEFAVKAGSATNATNLFVNTQTSTNYYFTYVSSGGVGNKSSSSNTSLYYDFANKLLINQGGINAFYSNNGGDVGISSTNQSSGFSSSATVAAGVYSNSASPKFRLVTPTLETNMYIDYTTKSFVMSNTNGVFMNVSSAGYINRPKGPYFEANLSSNKANVTGNFTDYVIVFDTVGVNIGSSYNNTNGRFTAPISGMYNFTASVKLAGLQSNHTGCFIQFLVDGTATRPFFIGNPYAIKRGDNDQMVYSGSSNINLNAGSYVQVSVNVFGGSKVVSVETDGTTYRTCQFTGCLLA